MTDRCKHEKIHCTCDVVDACKVVYNKALDDVQKEMPKILSKYKVRKWNRLQLRLEELRK